MTDRIAELEERVATLEGFIRDLLDGLEHHRRVEKSWRRAVVEDVA